jgi:nucleoside-diphosphate-sugar epimerase
MNILITGGTGFIGQAARRYVEAGHRVYVTGHEAPAAEAEQAICAAFRAC